MSLMVTVSVPESTAFSRIANDYSINTNHAGAFFPHYKFVVQFFQIHPIQCRAKTTPVFNLHDHGVQFDATYSIK